MSLTDTVSSENQNFFGNDRYLDCLPWLRQMNQSLAPHRMPGSMRIWRAGIRHLSNLASSMLRRYYLHLSHSWADFETLCPQVQEVSLAASTPSSTIFWSMSSILSSKKPWRIIVLHASSGMMPSRRILNGLCMRLSRSSDVVRSSCRL